MVNGQVNEIFYQKFDDHSTLKTKVVFDLYKCDSGELLLATNAGVWRYNGVRFTRLNHEGFEDFKGSYFKKDVFGNIWILEFDKAPVIVNLSENRLDIINTENADLNNTRAYHVYNQYLYRVVRNKILQLNLLTGEEKELYFEELNHFNIRFGYCTENGILGIEQVKSGNNYGLNLNTSSPSIYSVNDRIMRSFILDEDTLYSNIDYAHSSVFNKSGQIFHELDERFPPKTIIIEIKKFDEGTFFMTSSGAYWLERDTVLFPEFYCSDMIKDDEKNFWIATLNNGLIKIPSLRYNQINLSNFNSGLASNKIGSHENTIVFNDYSGNVYGIRNNQIQLIFTAPHKELFKKIIYVNQLKGFLLLGTITYFLSEDFSQYYQAFEFSNSNRYDVDEQYTYFYENDVVTEWSLDFKERTKTHQKKSFENENIVKVHFLNASGQIVKNEFQFKKNNGSKYASCQDNIYQLTRNELLAFNKLNGNILFSKEVEGDFEIAAGVDKIFLFNHKLINVYGIQGDWMAKIPIRNDKSVNKIRISEGHVIVIFDDVIGVLNQDVWGWDYMSYSTGIASTNFNDAFIAQNKLLVNGSPYISTIELKDLQRETNPQLKLKDFSVNELGNNSFRFEINSYSSIGELVYRIPSIDSAWSVNSGEYNELKDIIFPYGKSELEVRFQNDLAQKTKIITIPVFQSRPIYLKWWFIVSVLLTGVGLFYLILRSYIRKIKKKKAFENELTNAKLMGLKAQMNPHFLFNSLNSIQHLIAFNKNDEAFQYVLTFSNLVRKILNSSENNYTLVSQEISLIQDYLEMENLRFQNDFYFNITCPENLKQKKIPSMLIQPFVENSIKHGLLAKKGKKKVEVHFYEEDGSYLRCEIIDNGIGFKQSKANQSSEPYIRGSQLTFKNAADRLQLLAPNKKQNLALNYTDVKDENGQCIGARVIIHIPIIRN